VEAVAVGTGVRMLIHDRRWSSIERAPSCLPASWGWRPARSHLSPNGDNLNGSSAFGRGETGVSPRPQIDHIRRPQLLRAAADVIVERGLASTRIADVAGRAGTSPPAVLYWFRSKDELLAEALTVDEEDFYVEMRDRIQLLDRPRDQLRFMIEASAEEYDWTLWIELWVRALRDPAVREARQRLDDRWREEIAAVIRAGQGADEFGDADADEVALLLASLLDGLAVQATLHDPAVTRERMVRCALEMAESLLDCELGAAAYEPGAGDGSGAAEYAVREAVPHLADTEPRKGR
jgi:AcrR family transcriptional regulator